MSKTISFDQLPREVERFLRKAMEEHESLVFFDEGEPVGAVISMESYLQLHAEAEEARPRQPHYEKEKETDLSYKLPDDLLKAYHQMLDKKFSVGLTAEEEAELKRLDQKLDAAELSQPLVQSIRTKTDEQDKQWRSTLNEVIAKLRELRINLV